MRYFVTGERTLVSGGAVEIVAMAAAARTASKSVSVAFFNPSKRTRTTWRSYLTGMWWNLPEIFEVNVGQRRIQTSPRPPRPRLICGVRSHTCPPSCLSPMVLEFRPSRTRNFNESDVLGQTRIRRPRSPAGVVPRMFSGDHGEASRVETRPRPLRSCLFCFIHHVLVILFGNINERSLPRRLIVLIVSIPVSSRS